MNQSNICAGKRGSIEIYDTAGRMIRRLDIESSGVEQDLTWDGRDGSGHSVSSGIYFCRLRVSGQNLVLSVVMIE